MNLYDLPPVAAVLDAAHALLRHLAAVLTPFAGASSAAAAIVLVTVTWTLGQRLVLRRVYPLPPALPALPA